MPSARFTRSRKQQTRLQFQPLSSSSPAKNVYSDSVKDRLASVRFQGAKSKKNVSSIHVEESLPTPHPTSPTQDTQRESVIGPSSPLSSLRTSPPLPPSFADIIQDHSSDDDEEIVLPSSKRRKLSLRNDNYNMGNTSSAAGATESPDNSKPNSKNSGATTYQAFQSTPTRLSSRLAIERSSLARSDSSSSSQKLRSVDVPSPQRQPSVARASDIGPTQQTPTRRSTRLLSRRSPVRQSSSTPSSQRLASVDIATPRNALSAIGSAESSDDDIMVTKPQAKKRTSAQRLNKNDPFIVNDDEIDTISSEDQAPIRRERVKKRRGFDDFIVGNDDIEYISSDENSDDGPSPPKSRKVSRNQTSSVRHKRRSNARSKREQDEIDEDLKDLQDSEQEDDDKQSHTRGGPVTTQRDKTREHLELLKRRRAGQRRPRVVDSDVEEELNDDYDGADIDDIGNKTHRTEIISDEDELLPSPEQGYILDDPGDDDFIVEDQATTGRFGRPSNDLPLQFTSFASAKPRELFPHIVEWMVKNKISPAFNRNDEVYNLSFSRLDGQVKAQAGSRLISSAWNATFKYAIIARPGMSVTALPGLDEDLIRTCDACNKTNHPARYDFRLSGKAYSKDTLEPVDDSDDSDDDGDDSNDKISRDEQGHILASQNMHFYLGRFCAANAEMGHKLTHWKHHLNEQILSHLEEQGVLSAEAIVSREKLNKKKREKEAESIVDTMQETGTIAELWQAFKDDLEDARIGMEGYERKGGRGKARIGSVRMQQSDSMMGE